MTPAAPGSMAPVLVERFLAAMKAFVSAVSAAVAEAEKNPALATAPALRIWRSKALPLLEQQERAIEAAAALFRQGDAQPLLAAAADKRGLAKDLDGFPLDFAGPDHAANLDRLETAVVMAAWQLCSAAGIP